MKTMQKFFKQILCLIVAVVLMLSVAPINVFAVDVNYILGFVNNDGQRLYGTLTVQNAYSGTRTYELTQYQETITFVANSGSYYNVTFQNDDGYYRFFTFLGTTEEYNFDKGNTPAMLLKVPYTVHVKYENGSAASGIQVESNYDGQKKTTSSSGQCTIYATESYDTNIKVFDGYKWISKTVRPSTPGRKTIDFIIEKRVSVPVKVMLGGSEVTATRLTATSGDDTVTVPGNSIALLQGRTYTVNAEHYELLTGGIVYLECTNGFSGSASYTATESPATLVINAMLNKPQLSYWDYSTGSLSILYLNDGDSKTLSIGSSFSFSVENRISEGATYTFTSSNPDVFTVNGGSITVTGAGSASLTVKAVFGTEQKSSIITIKVPKKSVEYPASDTNTYTYTGSEQTYNIAANDAYTVSGNKQTAAGSYTVTVALKDKTQTQWSDGTTNNRTYSFKINKRNPSLTAPTAKDITYSGADQVLLNAGSVTGGTLQYALGSNDTVAPQSDWGTTVPSGKNAGDYYVWYKVVADSNHNDVAAKCIKVNIKKASLSAADFVFTAPDFLLYDGIKKQAGVALRSGIVGAGAITVKYYSGSTPLSSAPQGIGDYTVKVSVSEGDNYNAAQDIANNAWSFTVSYLDAQESMYSIGGNDYLAQSVYWYKQGGNVIIAAANGYSVSKALGGDYQSSISFSESEIKAVYIKRLSDGAMTDKIDISAKIAFDGAGPAGEIKIGGGNVWQSLINKITLGLFFNAPTSATVTSDDASGSGVKAVEYFIAKTDVIADATKSYAEAITLVEDAAASVGWMPYSNEIVLADNADNIIYVRLTDNVGNVTYINSNGVVLDSIAPTFEGIENGGVYFGDKTFKVADEREYPITLTLDGKDITAELDKNSYTLIADNKEHILILTDAAGNVKRVEVTVNKISDVTDIKADTVKPDDKTELDAAKKALEETLKNNDKTYSDEEKAGSKEKIEKIEESLAVIENVKAVEEKIAELPKNVTLADAEAVASGEKAYAALTEYEKTLVSEQSMSILKKARERLKELSLAQSPETYDNTIMWSVLLACSIALVFIAKKLKRVL